MNLYARVPDSKTAQTAVPVTFSTRARMGTFRKLPSLPSLPSWRSHQSGGGAHAVFRQALRGYTRSPKYTRCQNSERKPMSNRQGKGGGRTWDNLQAAHLRCNMSKGALNKTPFSSVGGSEIRARPLGTASAKLGELFLKTEKVARTA